MTYEILRSNRKTLALEVRRDGSVVVRAPRRIAQKSIDDFVARHRDWLAAQLARQAARRLAHPEPTPEEAQALRARAKAVLPERVDFFARRMGLTPAGVKITSAKTRFGSCSGKNSLCFSWRLMDYPPEAVDYVVVHELCHIVHKNHSPAFYALVASVLPDYRARQALLRQ